MEPDEIKGRFEKAVQLFMAEQDELLKLRVNERAVGATLAHLYVRELFPDHRVDAEYNRVGYDGSPKRLNLSAECGGENTIVYPDIVVHHRGINDENLLAVEIKLSTNTQSRDCDLAKLIGYREQLHYRVGGFVELPAGRHLGKRGVLIHWIE